MPTKTDRTPRSASGARRRGNSSGQKKRTSGRAALARSRSKAPDAKLTAGVAAISASLGAAAGAVVRPLVDRRLHPRKGLSGQIAGLPGRAKGIVKR